MQDAIDIKVLQTLGMARGTRSHALVAWRGPSPYVPCGEANHLSTVARGPVPRDLPTSAKNTRNPETTDGCCHDRCMARDRPSPYDEGNRFSP